MLQFYPHNYKNQNVITTIDSFIHAYKPASTLRLSNHTNAEHLFLGFVSKSVVRLGHYNRSMTWGWPFGRALREICPAISTHPHWGGDCTTTMRWQDAGATKYFMARLLGCGPIVGSPRSFSTPPSLGRGRVVPPPPTPQRVDCLTQWEIGVKCFSREPKDAFHVRESNRKVQMMLTLFSILTHSVASYLEKFVSKNFNMCSAMSFRQCRTAMCRAFSPA